MIGTRGDRRNRTAVGGLTWPHGPTPALTTIVSQPSPIRKAGFASAMPRPPPGVSPARCATTKSSGCSARRCTHRGGERRYTEDDLTQLSRILELREVLGMNLDEIKEFLSFETRLDELRTTTAPPKARHQARRTGGAEGDVAGGARAERITGRATERQAGPDGQLSGEAGRRRPRCRDLLAELD